MQPAIKIAESIIGNMHLRYECLNESTITMVMWNGKGPWTVVIRAEKDNNKLIVFSVFPFQVPREKRDAVARYITKVNFSLCLGNYEMDENDGELRFKTCVVFNHTPPVDDMVDPLLVMNFKVMDFFYLDIYDLVFDSKTDKLSSNSPSEELLESIEHWLKEIDLDDQEGRAANPEP